MVQNMITWFMMAAQARGQAVILYENPESVTDVSRQKELTQLNAQIAKNPKTPLPSGFILATEKMQVKEYALPNEARSVLGQAKCAALEILEGILSKSLDVHIFEPKVRLAEVKVVRFAMSKPSSSGSTSALSTPVGGAKALTAGQASR